MQVRDLRWYDGFKLHAFNTIKSCLDRGATEILLVTWLYFLTALVMKYLCGFTTIGILKGKKCWYFLILGFWFPGDFGSWFEPFDGVFLWVFSRWSPVFWAAEGRRSAQDAQLHHQRGAAKFAARLGECLEAEGPALGQRKVSVFTQMRFFLGNSEVQKHEKITSSMFLVLFFQALSR